MSANTKSIPRSNRRIGKDLGNIIFSAASLFFWLEHALAATQFYLDRCPFESEKLANLVFEIAHIRKVEVIRIVHGDQKFWRIDINLGAIVDLGLVRFSVASRGMLIRHLREKLIEYSCFYTLCSFFFDVFCVLENQINPPSLDR